MAGFFDNIPHDWLAMAQGRAEAEARSEEDLLRRDREEDRRRRTDRRMKLRMEREAAEPYEQFRVQLGEECMRRVRSDPRTSWMKIELVSISIFDDFEALKTVKSRWAEQGIWSNKWNDRPFGKWKHQEPLEHDSDSETETETDSESGGLFSRHRFFELPPKPKQPKSDDDKLRIARRRAERKREREASRPYHQFIYQISKKQESLQEEIGNKEEANIPDINTRAYENVKDTWIKRKIWNTRWGILPGMLWMHEDPIVKAADDFACFESGPLLNQL